MKITETVEAKVRLVCVSSPEELFEAWLDPEKVRSWFPIAIRSMGAAGDVRRVEIDPRVGGKFFFSDLRGDVEARHWGTYLELERPHKIVFTWIVDESEEADPSRVTLTLTPDGTGTLAQIVHQMDAAWAEYIQQTETGWARLLTASDAASHDAAKTGNNSFTP